MNLFLKMSLTISLMAAQMAATGQTNRVILQFKQNVYSYKTAANFKENIADSFIEDDKAYAFSIVQGRGEYSFLKFWHIYSDKGEGYVVESNGGMSYENTDFDYYENDKDVIDSIKRLPPEWDSIGLAAVKKYILLQQKKADQDYAKCKKDGLVLSYSYNYANEYSSGIDFSVGIVNMSKETIKYIWFYLSAYDAVEGKLQSFGKSEISLKGIGPIKYLSSGSYHFEYAFWSKVVNTVKVNRVIIEYMNGIKKTIPKPINHQKIEEL